MASYGAVERHKEARTEAIALCKWTIKPSIMNVSAEFTASATSPSR